MLNIQIQHKFKYAQQQILFFKRLFNVKLVYSIQVLGPWLWGNRPSFFLQWWGRGKGPVGQMPHHSMVLKDALCDVVYMQAD